MSDTLYLLAVVALTSLVAVVAGRRRGWRAAALGPALSRLLECAGLALGFYALNVGLGFVAVLLLRGLTGSFLSVYVNTDGTLAILSALQAVAWQWWRAESPPADR